MIRNIHREQKSLNYSYLHNRAVPLCANKTLNATLRLDSCENQNHLL